MLKVGTEQLFSECIRESMPKISLTKKYRNKHMDAFDVFISTDRDKLQKVYWPYMSAHRAKWLNVMQQHIDPVIGRSLQQFIQFYDAQGKCRYGTKFEERVKREAERYNAIYKEWDRFRRACVRKILIEKFSIQNVSMVDILVIMQLIQSSSDN